jgi:hypothetical protein
MSKKMGSEPNTKKKTGGKRENAGRKDILKPKEGETLDQMWDRIDTWLKKGVEGTGCAERLGVHPDTFYNFGIKCNKWGKGKDLLDFSAYKALKREVGNQNLHERQYDMAMGIYSKDLGQFVLQPNTTMLVWLGKQRLGQTDKNDVTTKGNEIKVDNAPVTVQIIQKPREDKRQG